MLHPPHSLSRLALALLAAWAVVGTAHAADRPAARADCPETRRGLADVRATLDVAMAGWTDGDLRLFLTAAADAQLAVSCLIQPLDPVAARRMHLLTALRARLEGRPQTSAASLDAACALGLRAEDLPRRAPRGGASLDPPFAEALAARVLEGGCLPQDAAADRGAFPPSVSGALYVDGQGKRYRARRPRTGPYYLQWQRWGVWETAYVPSGEARAPRYPKLHHVALAGAGASAATAGALFAASASAASVSELYESRARLNGIEHGEYRAKWVQARNQSRIAWTMTGISVSLLTTWAVLRF